MLGKGVKVKKLDMREWSGFGEPGQRGEACEGADVEEDLVAAQRACSSTVERDLEGPLGNKAAPSHHEFAAAGGELVQMRLDQAFHHRPLAGLNFPHRHILCDAGSERLARGYRMSDACTVDEVLARHAGDIRAGTAHIALLYDHDAFAGIAEMPRYRFSRLGAAEHHGIIGINCGHDRFPLRNLFAGNEPARDLACVSSSVIMSSPSVDATQRSATDIQKARP